MSWKCLSKVGFGSAVVSTYLFCAILCCTCLRVVARCKRLASLSGVVMLLSAASGVFGQAAPATAYSSFTMTIAGNLTKLDVPLTTNHVINSFAWGDCFVWDTGGGIFEVQIYPAAGGGADAKWFFQWDGPSSTFTHLGSGYWGTEQNFAICTLSVNPLVTDLAGTDVSLRLVNIQWGANNNEFLSWQSGAFSPSNSAPVLVWVRLVDGVWIGDLYHNYQYGFGPTVYDRVRLQIRGRLVMPAVYEWVFTISHGVNVKTQTSYLSMTSALAPVGYWDPSLTVMTSVGIWGGGFPTIENAVNFLPGVKWNGAELNVGGGAGSAAAAEQLSGASAETSQAAGDAAVKSLIGPTTQAISDAVDAINTSHTQAEFQNSMSWFYPGDIEHVLYTVDGETVIVQDVIMAFSLGIWTVVETVGAYDIWGAVRALEIVIAYGAFGWWAFRRLSGYIAGLESGSGGK